MQTIVTKKTKHLCIAGTGRAGTSFLVKYLTAFGLDTHLSRNKDDANWNESANAGLENIPLKKYSEDLPYVIKTPNLFQLIEQVLSDQSMEIETVIIPVRDLVDATTSRAIIEKVQLNQNEHILCSDQTWECIGYTAGGMIFSMNPIDQARILAVGFHQLIHKLVEAEIPIIFLDFPRFAEDSIYLFNKLKHLLPSDITDTKASHIHQSIVDLSKVRVSKEIMNEEKQKDSSNITVNKIYECPSFDKIDNIALRRELLSLRKEFADYRHLMAQKENHLTKSFSWRITKPLRVIKMMLCNVLKFKET